MGGSTTQGGASAGTGTGTCTHRDRCRYRDNYMITQVQGGRCSFEFSCKTKRLLAGTR